MAENNTNEQKYSLSAVDGFFPIDNDGIWHGGIHIKKKLNDKIVSPVNGTVVSYHIETENEKKGNYFLLKDKLNIPLKGEKSKQINCYSLLSNLDSYTKLKKEKILDTDLSLKDLKNNPIFHNKKLLFGINPYVYISSLHDLYPVYYLMLFPRQLFLHSKIFINQEFTQYLDANQNEYYNSNLRNVKHSFKENVNSAILKKSITYDQVTCPSGIKGKYINKSFIPNSSENYKLQYDELKSIEGYVEVDGNNTAITGTFGNIKIISNSRFFIKISRGMINQLQFYFIEKKEFTKISELLTSIKNTIATYNNTLNNQNNISIDSKSVKFIKESLVELTSEEQFLSQINNLINNNPKSVKILLAISYSNATDYVKEKIKFSYNSNYILYLKDELQLELYENNINLIHIEENPLYFNKILEVIKFKSIKYTNEKYTNFSFVDKINLPKFVNGYKLKYKNQEITEKNFSLIKKKIGVFKCRPYLFCDNKEYSFPISDIDAHYVFTENELISFNNPLTKKIQGILLFSNRNVQFNSQTDYDTEPSGILELDKYLPLFNFYDLLESYTNNCSEKAHADFFTYQIQTTKGYSFIDGKDINIKLMLADKLQGQYITDNTYLGSTLNNSLFFDWSCFFVDNLLELQAEKMYLNIPKDTPCKKITKPNIYMFFSNNTTIKTVNSNFIDNCKEIISVSAIITLYKSANKDLFTDTKNTITVGASINEFWFSYHKYVLKDNKLISVSRCETYMDEKLDANTKEVQIYAEKIILPKILNNTHTYKHINLKDGIKDPDSFQFTINLLPSDFATAYGVSTPLYIDTLSLKKGCIILDKKNGDKGQLVNIYYPGEALDSTLPINHIDYNYKKTSNNLVIIVSNTKDGKTVKDTYEIDGNSLQKYEKNLLEEYTKKLIPVNYKYKGYKEITNSSICPDNQLKCNLDEYKEKLKNFDNGKYKSFIDEKDSNTLYVSNKYSEALEAGIKNCIALHPLEYDKKLHEQLSKDVTSLIEVEEFSDENNDIAKEINKENKFYFVYPPLFYQTAKNAGLQSFNPYNKKSGKDLNGNEWRCEEDNPGFAPYDPNAYGTTYNGYASINLVFNVKSTSNNHAGIDFAGKWDFSTPVKSLINAKVIGKGEHKDWGNYVICQNSSNEKMFYILAHLNRIEVKINDIISPGATIGYVGNTGNCWSTCEGRHPESVRVSDYPEELARGCGTHLHLQIVLKDTITSIFADQIQTDLNKDSYNPLMHNEKWIDLSLK